MDRLFDKYKARLLPAMYLAIPVAAAFQIGLIYTAIGQVPWWVLFVGIFCTIICCAAALEAIRDD